MSEFNESENAACVEKGRSLRCARQQGEYRVGRNLKRRRLDIR
jgi:hypothetical protein